MLDMLLKNIIYGRTHYVIEHLGTMDQDLAISLLEVKEHKKELTISDFKTVSSQLEVKELFSKIKWASLLINNNQVVLKQVTITSSSFSELALLNQGFPNIDIDVFYYQIIRSLDTAFIYICRREYVDSLVDAYKEQKIWIRHLHFGFTSLLSVIPLLENAGSIITRSSDIQYVDGQLVQISTRSGDTTTSQAYQIDDFEVLGDQMNAFGAVISTHKISDQISSNYENQEIAYNSNFKQYRYYELGLPLAIIVLLVIFLTNFLLYNHYYGEVAELDAIGSNNDLRKELLIKKDSVVARKQKLFEDVIESSSSSSSYYIDLLLVAMPETIRLERLQYQPILKQVRKGKPILTQEKILFIAGETQDNSDISLWITTMENMEFVARVAIKSLEKKDTQTFFTIELELESR